MQIFTIKKLPAIFWLMGYLLLAGIAVQAQPTPSIHLDFTSGSTLEVGNTGTDWDGYGSFWRSGTTPAVAANVPVMVGGPNSLDFGTTPGNFYVESGAPIPALRNLNAFTLTGWINTRSSTAGGGGNRIISWINNGGEGVDLVYQSDGSLRIGIDQWPDYSPAFSSPNKVTTNINAPASNWVFFAVTYQSTGQVQFYFGNNATDAVLDVTKTYNGRGATGSNIGRLAVGAFNSATRNAGTYNRMFRGLIDDIQVHKSALSLTDIVAVQRGSTDVTPPTAPTNLALVSKSATGAEITWTPSTDNVGVYAYQVFNGAVQINAAFVPDHGVNLTNLTPGTTYSITVKAADSEGNLSGPSNTLTFTTDPASTLPMIFVKNSDYGTFQSNYGTLGGQFAGGGRSTNVPPNVGAAYSSSSTVFSFNVYSGLGNLNAFTVMGWVNARAIAPGEPDRLITWLGDGGDGVDLAVQSDGSMRLGVDNLATTSPAISSANKVTSSSSLATTNWVFFAVTYQANGQTNFYFGTPSQNASLDKTVSYPGQGPVGSAVYYTAIGGSNNATVFPNPSESSLNGLVDEVQIYNSVLTLQEIQARQYGPADTTPPTAPDGLNVVSKTETTVTLNWPYASTDNIELTGYRLYNNGVFLAAHHMDSKTPSTYNNMTATGLAPATTYTLTLKGEDAKGNLSAASNTVVVTTNGSASTLPLIDLKFESASASFNNEGTLPASFSRSTPPTPSNNIPSGVIGTSSLDFGTAAGNFYAESAAPIDGLKNLNAFTLTGWVNNKSNVAGSGGNRIISWINNGGEGVDLVYQSNGSLRLGVDGWPDGSPAFSSANKVPTNAGAPASNWTFFAVTYLSSGQVQFYFGNNTTDATLDVVRTYSGPGVTGANIGRLAIGAFNSATRTGGTYDRVFRGLIDNIGVYGKVLSASEIIAVQRSGGIAPAPPMVLSEITEEDNQLYQNYPNPFTFSTTVDMFIKQQVGVARVMVYDVSGRTLRNIHVEGRGETTVTIDGEGLNVGMYIYSLVTDGKVVDKKRLALTK